MRLRTKIDVYVTIVGMFLITAGMIAEWGFPGLLISIGVFLMYFSLITPPEISDDE